MLRNRRVRGDIPYAPDVCGNELLGQALQKVSRHPHGIVVFARADQQFRKAGHSPQFERQRALRVRQRNRLPVARQRNGRITPQFERM